MGRFLRLQGLLLIPSSCWFCGTGNGSSKVETKMENTRMMPMHLPLADVWLCSLCVLCLLSSQPRLLPLLLRLILLPLLLQMQASGRTAVKQGCAATPAYSSAHAFLSFRWASFCSSAIRAAAVCSAAASFCLRSSSDWPRANRGTEAVIASHCYVPAITLTILDLAASLALLAASTSRDSQNQIVGFLCTRSREAG